MTAPLRKDDRPRASPLLLFRGKHVRRSLGFVRSPGRIHCPAGHLVTERNRFLEDGTLYCDAREGQGQASCGAVVYVLVFPGRGGKRRVFAADCTREELATIERLGLDADGVLAYFGAEFTR